MTASTTEKISIERLNYTGTNNDIFAAIQIVDVLPSKEKVPLKQ